MSFASIPELLDEIRAGRMVVVVDDEDRENEGDLIMAASCVRAEDVNFMVREARGLVCLALTTERCKQLDLGLMVRENRSPHGTNFTVSIEAAQGVSTGISAHDRAHTIRTAVAPAARPADLTQPGHIFPLMAQPGGLLTRAGHTEAACDLARLAGLEPAGVLVEILNDDGSMARRPQLERFAARHGLKLGSVADLIRHRLRTEKTVERVHDATVDTAHGAFRLLAYRSALDHELHYALVRGAPRADAPTLVRVHVANPLSDALHLRDFAAGLSAEGALAAIAKAEHGVLVVLNERETGAAQLTRLKQPERVPVAGDAHWRHHGLGAQILADLGVQRIRVLGTPRRYVGLSGFGIEVVEYVETSR